MLIAAACLLMLLAAALALSLRAAGNAVAQAAHAHVLVQVVEADASRRERIADAVLARLDRLPRTVSTRRVPEQEAFALVDPYVGSMKMSDLPLPAMIEVRGADRSAIDVALQRLPHVQVTAAGAELGPLSRLIESLRAIAFGVALTSAAATGLIAMLSARAALAREGATIDILHTLGATDRQLSRLVTGKIARDAGVGAAVGLIVAIFVIATVGARVAELGAGVDASLGMGGWTILALLALALVGLAALAAQGALLMTWRRAP